MARFSLKRLFGSVTLVAAGCGEIAWVIRHAPVDVGDSVASFALFTCLPLIGAGLLTPFKKTLLGACIGFGITIIFFLLMPKVQ